MGKGTSRASRSSKCRVCGGTRWPDYTTIHCSTVWPSYDDFCTCGVAGFVDAGCSNLPALASEPAKASTVEGAWSYADGFRRIAMCVATALKGTRFAQL